MADSPEIVHKKSTETIISTISSTTESGQIEDVELVVGFFLLFQSRLSFQNVEDEEDEYEENNDDITETTELDEDDDPKEQSLLSEEQKLAAEMANSLADREFVDPLNLTIFKLQYLKNKRMKFSPKISANSPSRT